MTSNISFRLLTYTCIFFVLIGSCKDDPIEEPPILGPPQIENFTVSQDTVPQDPNSFSSSFATISFDYINEFGELGAPTNQDTLLLTLIDLRFNDILPAYRLFNEMNLQNLSFTNGKVSLRSPGTCCVIDNMACQNWEDTFQEVTYQLTVTNQEGEVTESMMYTLTIDCR